MHTSCHLLWMGATLRILPHFLQHHMWPLSSKGRGGEDLWILCWTPYVTIYMTPGGVRLGYRVSDPSVKNMGATHRLDREGDLYHQNELIKIWTRKKLTWRHMTYAYPNLKHCGFSGLQIFMHFNKISVNWRKTWLYLWTANANTPSYIWGVMRFRIFWKPAKKRIHIWALCLLFGKVWWG